MSTPNFYMQDNFDTYVIDFEPLTDEEIEQYEADNDCEYSAEADEEFFYEDEISNYKWLVKEFLKKHNKELKYFKPDLQSGYYAGIQTYIEQQQEYLPEELDNDDCHYYYDCCRSKAIRECQSEINFINNKLLPYIRDNSSFNKINCIGVFSNGEAIYEWSK